MIVRQRAARAALALRRELGVVARSRAPRSAERTCGRDHPHGAAIQQPADELRRVGRHAHQRRDAALHRRDADLAHRVDRQRVVLDIDIDRVEPGSRRDARDLDRAAKPHRHRCHHLVARQLLFHAVAQDVAQFVCHGCLPDLSGIVAHSACAPQDEGNSTTTDGRRKAGHNGGNRRAA